MNATEAAELLRARRILTGSTYNDETISAWRQALAGADYEQCRAALDAAALCSSHVTIANIFERLPLRQPDYWGDAPTDLCIRCGVAPAEPNATRCASCRAETDAQLARGETLSSAMDDAIARAKRVGGART